MYGANSIAAAGVMAICAMWTPAHAKSIGGRLAFDGGTPAQQREVGRALGASAFDWGLVPRVEIHIRHGADSYARPGQIWLDADLLDAGAFAWGVVQHEFAHQVDFLLLSDRDRAVLLNAIGRKTWCSTDPRFRHEDLGCERFASTLAWSYWPSAENCMRPEGPVDESTAMPPAQFRTLVDELVRRRTSTNRKAGRP